MKKSQLWSVTQTHMQENIRDVDTWAIINLKGNIIAKFSGLRYDREAIEKVINVHNSCFVEED